MKCNLAILAFLSMFFFHFHALASPLDGVLQQVRNGSMEEKREAEQRVRDVNMSLQHAKSTLDSVRSQLEETNKQNIVLEDRIIALQEKLKQRQKQYKSQRESVSDVFETVSEHGALMQERVAPYGLWKYDTSEFQRLDKESTDLTQINRLWLALTEQIALSGKAITHSQSIMRLSGEVQQTEVTQYGPFNAFTTIDSVPQWLTYMPAQKIWSEMSLESAYTPSKEVSFIDPSFGELFMKEATAPSWFERIAPAGIVGVLIGLVGLIGLGIAISRSLILRREKQKIVAQINNTVAQNDNALGRVILATEQHDLSQIDAVIDEAVLKEVPAIRFGIGSLAVFASIPPLLGLLGTVGGMIETFRVITEHGSANSQLLSGGISQALLTTELGLIVAVPLLLLHCGLKAQSVNVIEILEQQSAGLIVMRQYQQGALHD